MVAGSELHSWIFCSFVFIVPDLGEPRQTGRASGQAVVVGTGHAGIGTDGIGVGHHRFRVLPFPRIAATLDLWDRGVSCRMETSGLDLLSAGVPDFDDSVVNVG